MFKTEGRKHPAGDFGFLEESIHNARSRKDCIEVWMKVQLHRPTWHTDKHVTQDTWRQARSTNRIE